MSEELSDYEQLRADNIRRNNARLRALGLISILEEKRSNAIALGKPLEVTTTTKRKRKRGSEPTEPSRKSLRVQGLTPDGKEVEIREMESEEEREARVEECRRARQQAALEVAEADAAVVGKQNPTATYGHCLMRVQTMNPAGLARRVRVIEKAAGKHCVVKMAIFKSCLQDEGMWDLAELASDALERLKALQPPPDE
mmetsp:Transcript_15700/g.23908  ORF Transcript_15700/g.23908 Transcript_15700/m.23908 type:complete len:198 (-) Transcript_15700:192-785(-)|eukprot:CAMPEP_0118691088 /NCGR_PEP_ID=MMETSP0800-20121206/10483_1 /TAXON_ID=210618 ORGANISM="Striatella unipunctata, Strain CCMP2910" /NCGR_SAMPLE_ID=MMETSP0800 /ASSEMBLY_ACC=CAM_ASM_000638 /LENGTH=197 /DNA_ID=CAMNT_0006588823 /DNA_START=183 /DNA_END=776 /DNA_ORIENTATION=+